MRPHERKFCVPRIRVGAAGPRRLLEARLKMVLSIKVSLFLSLNHPMTRGIGGFNEGQRPLGASAIRMDKPSSRNKVVSRG